MAANGNHQNRCVDFGSGNQSDEAITAFQRHSRLEALPLEVLQLILGKLPREDLTVICTLSRWLCHAATPLLHQSVFIRMSSKPTRTTSNIKHVLGLHNHSGLCYAKELHFNTPLQFKPYPCLSKLLNLYGADSDLVRLLEYIPDNSLRKFEWDLSACLPKEIMGKGGYLPRKQTALTYLSLFTCAGCAYYDKTDPGDVMDLSQFAALDTFKWKAVMTENHFTALRACLHASAKSLKSLTLDFVDYDPMHPQSGRPVNCVFGSTALGLKRGARKRLFPTLESLILRGAPFEYPVTDIAAAFPFDKLQVLVLHRCDVSGFLEEALECCQSINVQRLELVQDLVSSAGDTHVINFLDACERLEDVFLMFLQRPATGYLEAVHRHAHSLRRLAYHEREFAVWYNEVDKTEITGYALLRILRLATNLDFLGVCLDPMSMMGHFMCVNPRPNLRLLHIRAHHTAYTLTPAKLEEIQRELAELATWVFGPDGMPELQMIIYGDASYDFRAPYNIYLQRREKDTITLNSAFRELSVEEVRQSSLVREHLSALEACPVDTITDRSVHSTRV